MSKKKFSWDLFTDENENIVMKDTKDKEMIFLQMAEEQGIEVNWRDFNYSNDNCHCYYSFAFGNKICMSECKCHTDDEIYSLQEVIEGLKSNDIILEDGDKVGEYKLTFSDIFNHEPGTMFYMNGDRKHILIVTTEEEGGEVLELILPSNEDFKPIKMSKAYMNAYYVREDF